ncbi:MAG: hypothetical protein ACOX3W_00270 [Christensenellaceae bacterium]|jgi:hypothetical protein
MDTTKQETKEFEAFLSVLHAYPAHFTRAEKMLFLERIAIFFSKTGRSILLERNGFFGIQNINLTAGHMKTARYIIAASYDTPARNLFGGMQYRFPRISKVIFSLLPILFLLLIALVFINLLHWPLISAVLLVCPLYLFCVRFFGNRQNKNASSGLVAAYLLMQQLPPNICLVLCDHGYLGKLGLRSFLKTNKIKIPVLYLEALGVGQMQLLQATKAVAPQETPISARLTQRLWQYRKYKLFCLSSVTPSPFGYYVPHIGTPRDTSMHLEQIIDITNKIKESLLPQ